MSIATHGTARNYLQRAPSPSSLADVVDLILDKGLVIDAYVRVSVIGIELVTIDARGQPSRPHADRGGRPQGAARGRQARLGHEGEERRHVQGRQGGVYRERQAQVRVMPWR
jgi:gas vesicle protein GvpA/GvpJ/GvpM family